jgi:hypothetical protein
MKRLESDQVALKQLQNAANAFAMKSGASSEDSGNQAASGKVVFFQLPTPNFIEYVMANADVYPALCNVMVSQWLSRGNPPAFDHTFRFWWSRYHTYFRDSFLHPDADRFHRLSELAIYERKFAHLEAAQRFEKFQEHAKEYAHLSKHHSIDSKRTLLGLHEKPNHKDTYAVGHDPYRPAHKGAVTKVSHEPHPSTEHQIHHGLASHTYHVQHYTGRRK